MIVVAVVGVDLAVMASFFGPFLMLLPTGPLGGIAWASRRMRGRRCANLRGSLRGSVVQAVPITLLMTIAILSTGNEWGSVAIMLWFVPLTSLAVGMAIGLLAELVGLLRGPRILLS